MGTALPEDRPLLIEFFYSPSQPSRDRLPVLNEMAKAYDGRVTVLVLARESRDRIEVQYVPFSVLMDAKGRVSWFGNSAELTPSMIETELNL